jgi:hypothetical protein
MNEGPVRQHRPFVDQRSRSKPFHGRKRNQRMTTSMVTGEAPSAHPLGDDTPTESTAITGDAADLIAGLWQPRFPSPELLREAAALLPRVRRASSARDELLTEGPRTYIRVGPGVIEVRTKDYARAERAAERHVKRRELDVAVLADYFAEHGCFPDDPEPTRTITEWSRKSQANMVRKIGSLDFTPMYTDRTRLPGMVTLTYPGDWLTVAPSGKVVKDHLKAFRKRYERAWGEPLRCVWKLEFQRRGAPHVHMLMVPPHGHIGGQTFREWISLAWADVVAHPDPGEYAKHVRAGTGVDYAEGLRASDPRRVAVYFLKHSTFADKAYQHIVPEEWQEPGKGPGRFWGYWGLRAEVVAVEVEQATGDQAGRTLRRWSAAQQVTREVRRPRVKGGRAISKYHDVIGLAGAQLLAAEPAPRHRKTRTRARRMSHGRGFLLVNSGVAITSQLARYLNQ